MRVLRVQRDTPFHTVQEYQVATRLFAPVYKGVFTEGNNAGLVTTDTQKNTVYVVAKRTTARCPEEFALDMAAHLLREYPSLSAAEVDVEETVWRRVEVEGRGDAGARTQDLLGSLGLTA